MKPGDAVLCLESKLYKGCKGIVMTVEPNRAPWNEEAAEVNFVGQGTVWIPTSRLQLLNDNERRALADKLAELIRQRRNRGLY